VWARAEATDTCTRAHVAEAIARTRTHVAEAMCTLPLTAHHVTSRSRQSSRDLAEIVRTPSLHLEGALPLIRLTHPPYSSALALIRLCTCPADQMSASSPVLCSGARGRRARLGRCGQQRRDPRHHPLEVTILKPLPTDRTTPRRRRRRRRRRRGRRGGVRCSPGLMAPWPLGMDSAARGTTAARGPRCSSMGVRARCVRASSTTGGGG